eukprot:450177-Pyramimonas_sp.AAC.1
MQRCGKLFRRGGPLNIVTILGSSSQLGLSHMALLRPACDVTNPSPSAGGHPNKGDLAATCFAQLIPSSGTGTT